MVKSNSLSKVKTGNPINHLSHNHQPINKIFHCTDLIITISLFSHVLKEKKNQA